ncbi:methyltransferase family protein [Lophium mytilinum]|uniref:Methyltransferase family protein n=1 Tax=Lophium mytilinum TaxID=390894 RepID=A0A6A6R5H6_9PEZI|nr:methyltransferase family protein [Lophium mytilinum]
MTEVEKPAQPVKKGNPFAGTEGIYLLPHHIKEIERLRGQHRLILSSTGNTLLTAPIKEKKPRVLDSGAADGTWLLDLQRLYPQYEWSLHGVDIGSALFPHKSGPYESLDLHELDARAPAPSNLGWEGSFDLIHQRLLIWGFQKKDWPAVLKNQLALLKPGGWIQLVETQWVDRDHPFDAAQYPNLAKQTTLQTWSTDVSGMDIFIAYNLEDHLKELGFENVSKRDFVLGYGAKAKEESQNRPSADLWIKTFTSFGERWPEGGIPGVAKTKEEFYQFLEDLKNEVSEVGYAPKISYVIGQKPL